MHGRRFLFFVLVFLFAFRLASAQDVLSIDKTALNQHVTHSVPPIYPPIAKAVRIQGTVNFEVVIGETGKIKSMKVVSGHPMLQQAATDSLKQWVYHPFEKDGKPVEATGPVSITFSLGNDESTSKEEEIASRYFPLSEQCRRDVSAKKDYSSAASVCKKAADATDEFAPNVRFIEKRSASVWAAWAFLYNNDLKAALIYATKAVDVVKLGHDDNSGNNAAYCIKGMVEGKMGDLTAADQDLTTAEDYERKGIVWADEVKFEHGDSYKRVLVQNLRFHAQVLHDLKRPDDAQKKLDEAAKYN